MFGYLDHDATEKDCENQRDRDIRVVLSPGWKTRPDPIAKMKVRIGTPGGRLPTGHIIEDDIMWPEHPKVSTPYDKPRQLYKIRYVEGYGGVDFVGACVHRIEIMDQKGNVKQFQIKSVYMDAGGFNNVGGKLAAWAEVTSNAQSLDEFEGRDAVIGSASMKMFGKKGLAILGTVRTELDTCAGVSVGASPVNASYGTPRAE